jgi:hypothetical protein
VNSHTHTHTHDEVLFQIVFWQFGHLCCQQSRCISLVVTSSPSWQRDEEQQKTKAEKKLYDLVKQIEEGIDDNVWWCVLLVLVADDIDKNIVGAEAS